MNKNKLVIILNIKKNEHIILKELIKRILFLLFFHFPRTLITSSIEISLLF